MNQVNRRRPLANIWLPTTALASGLAIWSASVAKIHLQPKLAVTTACASSFKFERINSISMRDFVKLSAPVFRDNGAASILYYAFDDEDYPISGGWIADGLVVIKTSDLGAIPLAGIVWSHSSAHLVDNKEKNSEFARLILKLDNLPSPCSGVVEVSLNRNGVARFGKIALGKVR
jgi:hypothetical protein